MRITREFWWSAYVLDVAAIALFLCAWAVIVRTIAGSAAAAGVLIVWTVLYSAVAAGTYSDLLALALFVAAIATGLRAATSDDRSAWIAGAASAGLMAAACVVRYAYWPLAIVVPAATIAAKRTRSSWMLALVHVVVVGAAILATAQFMQRATGEALFLSRWYPDERRGFFWSHLTRLNPFPAEAIGAGRLYALVAKDRPVLTAAAPVVLWSTSAVCLFVAVAYVIGRARRWVAAGLDAAETFFVVAGVLTFGAAVATNVWLTLRLPAASDGWTVGGEPRYYVQTLPFLATAIWLAARDASRASPPVRTIAVVLVAGALLVSVPVRAIRVRRYFAKNIETAWMSARRRSDADVIIGAIRAIDDGRVPPLVVDDSPNWSRYVETMAGALVVTRAQIRACAGRDASEMRFLIVDDGKAAMSTGSPCAPRPAP